jgi:hypothetical protein
MRAQNLSITVNSSHYATIASCKRSTETPVAATAKRPWANRVVRLILFMGHFLD